MRLNLKPLRRTYAPEQTVLIARLGGPAGPIIGQKEIDEFTLETSTSVGLLVVEGQTSGGAR